MSTFTPIEKLGREQLIQNIKLTDRFKRSDVLYGIGDDAAVLRISDFESSLLTSETFVENVDFDIVVTPLHHLGYKLTMAAMSDILAMNGLPTGIMVNLAIPNKCSVEMIDELYKGIHFACEAAETELIGGDITATRGPLVISISVYGKVDAEKVVYRSGAKVDDAVCVTGDLGGALAGLRVLLREKANFEEAQLDEFKPDLSNYEYVVKRQLLPTLRFDFIRICEENNVLPTALTDVSQGLVHDLTQLINASGVGAFIYQAAIPIATETRQIADEMETDVDRYALYGGEDFELLFTMPKEDIERMYDIFDDFSVIGKITEAGDGLIMQTADGDHVQLDKTKNEESI